MKKIGIITFHRAKNYGAVLQSYALQQTIQKLGGDCEIVDYKCENVDNGYKPFQLDRRNLIKSFLKTILMFRKRKLRIKRFSNFYNNRLVLSEKTYSADEISQCKDKYDIFIAGSDQIWGPGTVKRPPDGIYFLNFADDRQKYSYAASFGRSRITDDRIPVLQSLLSGFQAYSVREESAVDIIKQVTGKQAMCHIDPTFLIGKEGWLEVSKAPEQQNYILVFNVKPVKSLIKFAEKLSAEKNLPVIYLTDNPHKPRKNFKYVVAPTVEEFVGYFANASYTVTNSFHGTAFSVIFNRNLFVEFEARKGGYNDRASSLLAKLGIDREIKDGNCKETLIDWKNVNSVIEEEKRKALDYLKTLV